MLKTPPLQTATATIETLCARLSSATLLEDRRAAILGLRSFAKQYPASVASGSLRELIATLRRDGLGSAGSSRDGHADARGAGEAEGGDVDTIRLVLETLLMLFNPDSGSPEASDEVAFFMADGFSMRQDNITLLLSLLDPVSPFADYYSRLYSVQLLSAICAARPERLQECVLSAPLGVSRLVGVLDDTRDAVRNAGLLLLIDLTGAANEDLRKIVAFEDVFARIFNLIRAEGGLAEAGITAQDCLSLLANLIKGSASNQTMFRESGCVTQMTQLLQQAFPPAELEAGFIAQAREKAAWGLLQLLQLFLEPGEPGTPQNQLAFFRTGTAQVLIDLAFVPTLAIPVRIAALRCSAALISNNHPLQEAFAALTVDVAGPVSPADTKATNHTNGSRSTPASARNSARPSIERPRTYIIEALLDLTLSRPLDEQSLRIAACALIQSYLAGHDRIKSHFLSRAIAGHGDHETAANVLATLLSSASDDANAVVYASWIVCDLVAGDPEAKIALASVKEGDESAGEDVMTSVQTLGSQLQGALQSSQPRLVAAYAALLIALLWDFAPGVNDLLAEGSGLLQSLIAAASPSNDAITAGLSAALLGTLYEFSTKDTPIPRRAIAPLLTQKLGRSKYLEALTALRRDPAIQDVDLHFDDSETVLSKTFADMFTLDYSRLRKAIDKDPGKEVLPASVVEEGVDRDILDDLRQQIQTSREALAQAQEAAATAALQAEQDLLTKSKESQTAVAEAERVRRINQAMQSAHESDLAKLEKERTRVRAEAQAERVKAVAAARKDGEDLVKNEMRELRELTEQRVREFERRGTEVRNLWQAEGAALAVARKELEGLRSQHVDLETREREVRGLYEDLGQRHQKLEVEAEGLRVRVQSLTAEVAALTASVDAKMEQLSRLEAQVKELTEEVAAKEEELAQERKGYEELVKELEGAKSVGGGELAEAREAEKTAKEELESMLLVMEEIEAKRDTYRARVKELGGEVTEGEESEEEEEEE